MNKVINSPGFNLNDMVCDVIYDQYKGKNVELFLQSICQVMDNNIGVFLRTYHSDVLSLKSAKGIALDIWGSMLHLPRSVQINDPDLKLKLNDENFIKLENVNDDGTIKKGIFIDDAYRLLLQLRLQTQNTPASIPEMSKMISNILNSNIAINDHLDMQFITFYISDELPAYLDAMIADPELDLLPRPAGTGVKVLTSIWRYHYTKYEGETNRKLSNFYVSIFYDPILNEDNIPIYKTLVYYTNSDVYFRQHKSWYDLTPFKAKLDEDERQINDELQAIASAGENQEQFHEATYNFYHVNQDSIDPGVWSDLYDEVFKEYYDKKPAERVDMSEEWEIKNVHLEYLIQKRYNFNLNKVLQKVNHLTSSVISPYYKVNYNNNQFIKDLYFNSKDGFYYTDPGFNIDTITHLCVYNNYLCEHYGLMQGINHHVRMNLDTGLVDNKPDSLFKYDGMTYDEIKQEHPEEIYLVGHHLDNTEYIELYNRNNPFYNHWKKVFEDKIDGLPNLDSISEYQFLQRLPTSEFTEKEILFTLLYIAMIAYRNANEKFARHLSDMRSCTIMMESLKRAKTRFQLPSHYADIEQVVYVNDGEYDRPVEHDKLIHTYQQQALIFEKVAADFGGKNHSTTVANTYKILADNIKMESRIFNTINDFLTQNCRELMRGSSFTEIGQKMVKIMNASKERLKERLDKLGNDDLTKWFNDQIDSHIQKLLNTQKEYIKKHTLFDESIKDAFDDDKFLTKAEEYGRNIQRCFQTMGERLDRLSRTRPAYRQLQDKANSAYNSHRRLEAADWATGWNKYTLPGDYRGNTQNPWIELNALGVNNVPDEWGRIRDVNGDSHNYGWYLSLSRDMRSGSKRESIGNVNSVENARRVVSRWFEHQWYDWQAKADRFIAEIRGDESVVKACKDNIEKSKKFAEEMSKVRDRYLESSNIYLPEYFCK